MGHVVSEAVHIHLNNGLPHGRDDYNDDQSNDVVDGGDDGDDNDDNPPHKYSFRHLHVRGQEPPKKNRRSAELK